MQSRKELGKVSPRSTHSKVDSPSEQFLPTNIICLDVCSAVGYTCADTMTDMNIPANDAPAEQAPAIAPPTRMDDQILPSILDTMCFNSSTGLYNCQLNEKWFNLHKDILKDALDITPTNDNNPFVAPPSSDTVIEYVNTLGYLNTLRNVSTMSVNALYQPWRAILSMINMCHTGKTAGYDRPRHHVLQILRNLATASRGKKKTTHLLITSVRFTKLIIHHLKTKHNIHLRSGSLLHYSHDENVLNTLRFVGKDSREIFGMPITDVLLTDEIKRAPYNGEYQEHVAKYQQYLDAKHGKAEEGGATESPKATKVTKPKAAKATKLASDPKPKPAPTQPSKAVPKKKQKLVQKTLDEPLPAKRSKGGLVRKIRKPISSLKLVDEPSDEDVSVEEPAYNEEEANLQRALELSLKEQAERTHGPARLVVIKEPDSGRIQPLSDVQGKGKEKFRRTPMPTEAFGPVESPSLDTKLALTDSETKSDDVEPKINTGDQDKGQAGPNPGIQDEGQDGPNPGVQDEGQAGSNPGDAAESQPQLSHVVHAGPNLKPMDLEATDASTLQNPEQMDKEFTTTAYPSISASQISSLWRRNRKKIQGKPMHKQSNNLSSHDNNYSTTATSTTKTGDITNFLNWYCRQVNKTKLTQADFEGQTYETNPEEDQVRVDVNRPLPLGGPPGHVTIQSQFFFNKDLEYVRHGSKGSSPGLSISMKKAARYPDFGLELLVLEQMWIEDVYMILCHVKKKSDHTCRFSVSSELKPSQDTDFKNLHPSDFEDLNLLLLQGHLNHLLGSDKRMLSTAVKLWTGNLVIRQWVEDFQLGIESYQTQLNLTKPGCDAADYKFKHDYTIIESPRAVLFPVNNNGRKIMRFNEIYKFSDGTLTRILEALAYRVKEFKIKRLNLGMNTRFWTQKDVTKSKEFIAAIERRLNTKRIVLKFQISTHLLRGSVSK
uniref:Uncharacterized protein n=1 Tax=Tanacetum cinerariifolium TaxID=118510 RepID=A0A6L2MYS9_TANCI|nr:hypothetical protein [Tanacetum cinerariifolium]